MLAIASATVKMHAMPIFTSDGTRVYAAYITGPSHILLGLQFSDSRVDSPVIVREPAIGRTCHDATLEEARLVEAVLQHVAKVRRDLCVSKLSTLRTIRPTTGSTRALPPSLPNDI